MTGEEIMAAVEAKRVASTRSQNPSSARSFLMAPLPHYPLLVFFILLLLHSAQAISPAGSGAGYAVAGRIKLEGFNSRASGHHAKMPNVKIILNGGQRVTFARQNGFFSFDNVPAGTHLIEVSAMGFLFSPVRVDISAKNPGKIQAALTENRRALSELILEPMREEQYYEVREPFSVMSLVKSPMGLMVGFMLIVVFIMPKLVENMDPEEIRRAQEEMRSQGVPSLSGLLSGQTQ
ncbi:ER membrane protein complex subunit 7 homolog [Wolffia australiana]